MANEAQYLCDVYAREFGTVTGLGLHRKRAHPVQFNQGIVVERVKRRWSPEELELLAEREASLAREGCRGHLIRRLVDHSGGRTMDSIKGIRKTEEYKRLVVACMARADQPTWVQSEAREAGSVSSVEAEGGGGIGGVLLAGERTDEMEQHSQTGSAVMTVAPRGDGNGHEEELRSALRNDLAILFGLARRCAHAERLCTAIETVLRNGDPADDIVRWWRGLQGGDLVPEVVARGGRSGAMEWLAGAARPLPRQLRRMDYAEVQMLWKRDRKAVASRVLGGGRDLGNQTMQDMVRYWAPLFEAESMPWDGETEPTVDTWSLGDVFGPVQDTEILDARPRPGTCAGPDGIDPSRWNALHWS